MTAIAVVQLATGFIFASDGRMRIDDETKLTANAEMLALETDTAQKIFPIIDKDISIAFAITGVIGNDDFSFNLVEEAKRQTQLLSGRSFASFENYIVRLSANINRKIIVANHFPKTRERTMPGEWLKAIIVFAGYFKSAPVFTSVSFTIRMTFRDFRKGSNHALFWLALAK